MPAQDSHIGERFLFEKLAQGDEDAYTRLFHLFTPRLIPYMRKITRDEQLAKELLQETFLKLWLHRSDLSRIDEPAAWLFRVAANTCFMYLRTQANHARIIHKLPVIENTGNNVIEYADKKELDSLLQNAVDNLPPRRQQIYRLRIEQGFSHQQIAEKMEISLQTVKNEMGIARKCIQNLLHKSFILLSLFVSILK